MIICEIVMIVLTLAVCFVSSYTDIKSGKIYNSFLISIVTIDIVLDSIYYFVFNEYIIDFFANILIIACLSIILYAFHIWAAGDSKMLIVALLSFPARWYVSVINLNYTLVFIVAFSFVAGYMYIIIDSIISAIKKKAVILPKDFLGYFKQFFINYLAIINFLWAFNLLDIVYFSKYVKFDFIAYFAVGLLISLIISKAKILRSIYVIAPIFIINVAIGIILKIGLYQIDYKSYIFVITFEIIRFFASKYNYIEIETKNIKPGMILSTASSILINMSKSENIPGISKEDQRNRLTVSESKAVIAWGKSRYGAKKITIVRKVPFAIFISFGVIIYLILGGFII